MAVSFSSWFFLMVVLVPSANADYCLDYLNGIRAKHGLRALGAATWDGYRCAYSVATQDAQGPNWHAHFGQCSEDAQCEAEGQSDCKGGIDAYYSEGPGGGHYDIIMGNYCYMAWGFCSGCSPIGTFMTHNFYRCKEDSTANLASMKVTGRQPNATRSSSTATVIV